MFKRLIGPAAIFGMAAIAPPALAQATCANRADITSNLAEKFGETHIGGGLQSGTQMIEIWSSAKTGSFTILLTRPNGISCIVSSGKHWDSFETAAMPLGIQS